MAASDVIGTGTAGGLLAFCDLILEQDHASCGVVHPWKYAVKQVLRRVDGDDFEAIDVRTLDVDEYMQRLREHRPRSAGARQAVRVPRALPGGR